MKRWIIIATGCLILAALGGWLEALSAGTSDQIKEKSKKAAAEIKEGAVQTGKAVAETGKKVKEGSQKGWSEFKKDAAKAGSAVKDSVKGVGREFKKAFHETKEAVKKEFSTDAKDSADQ